MWVISPNTYTDCTPAQLHTYIYESIDKMYKYVRISMQNPSLEVDRISVLGRYVYLSLT